MATPADKFIKQVDSTHVWMLNAPFLRIKASGLHILQETPFLNFFPGVP
ncbi:MAG: hypothetical protein ABIJ59_19560 [Pseudomonadota bacterium]